MSVQHNINFVGRVMADALPRVQEEFDKRESFAPCLILTLACALTDEGKIALAKTTVKLAEATELEPSEAKMIHDGIEEYAAGDSIHIGKETTQ